MKKILIGFGIPRVGSSHLYQLLNNIDDLLVYHEVFHPHAAYGIPDEQEILSELSRSLGVFVSSLSDESLTSYMRENPDVFLDLALSGRYGDGRFVALKIFPGHLADDAIYGKILKRKDVSVFVMHRRPIDAYISDMKAGRVGQHNGVNTSGLSIDLDVRAFEVWWDEINGWYGKIYKWLKEFDIPFFDMSFENDIVGDNSIILSRFVRKANEVGLGFNVGSGGNSGLSRQDLTSDYRKKVNNWEQFLAEFEEANSLGKLYDYFTV